MDKRKWLIATWWTMMFVVISMSINLAHADAIDETRCCVTPARDSKGVIIRRADVLREFQKAHPCPATGLTTGACPGWAKDHVIPLSCGGRDEVSNLQWLPDQIKSAAGTYAKDRFERKIYCQPMQVIVP